MPYDKIDQLYDALKKDGAVSKSRENFRSKMLAPGKEGYQNRLQLYNALKADGAIDSPTYEEFGKRLGLHAVNNTSAPKPQPQKPAAQAAPAQQKPTTAPAQAATPAPSTAPAKPQPKKNQPLTQAQRQAMIDQVQQMQYQTNASLQRTKNKMDFARANAGLNVPRVTIGDKNSGIRLGQNSKVVAKKSQYNPKSGKMERTYITESGNEYTNRGAADLEQNAIDEEARQPLGISMNDQQVDAAQKPANAAVAALWKEAEAKYAADRNKNAEEVYSGNPWLHAGREMHIVDAATNSHKNEVSRLTRFDLQKMMDNAWGRVGKQMTASCYQQLKKQYPTATERQLQMSAEEMARQLSDNAVYKYAVAKNTPKSTLEFFAKTAADTNLIRTISKGLARSEAGTTGDMAAYEQAMSDYGKNHRWAQIGGTVTGMMFDPTTYISGGVGSFAGKTALNLGGRIVAKKAATNVGARLFGNTLTGRVVAGVAGGAGNLGTYEGIKEGESQWLHGGHINPQTGENEGYSAGDVVKSTLHGTLLGSVTGTVSPLLGNVADKWVKATSNTAGKVGIRAGELATSTVAEGTIFSIPEWISGDGDAMDVWTDNMAMMIGFKGQHMIKSAPRVIAGLRPIADPKTMQERNHNNMSFLERLRRTMDAGPRKQWNANQPDIEFTKEEREELQRYGYGDLAALFTRTPKQQPKPKAKPTTTDGKVMYLDIPEAEVEDLGKQAREQWLKQHPEFDGYETMERLMQDPNVSQSARAKAYYILTGRQLPMGTVTGYTTETDENGNIFVKAVTANGEVVTNRRFADEASAKREQDNIMRQAELNSVDVGERYTEAKADNKVWDAAIEAVAPGADPETVKRNYQAAKNGDKDAIANYGQMVEAIDKFVEANKGMADAERPEAIRAAIKEETGVDVDEAIKKEPSKRNDPEKAAVQDYIERLFPEQSKEAEQPTSDAEAEASAVYDQSRLLWDKVEQGDADAKADVDAIVLRMQEALQNCEDAFGTDAEMRMAEMQDNPWALANDPELSEDQQDAVLYYVNAKAAMEGVMDASNEAADGKRKEVEANVERHTHKDMGVVQPATMKVDDKPVYVVKGNVVMLPDGSGIDVRNSDQSIVICDAETGEYKFASPDQLFSLGEAIDPQTELDEAYANIQAEHEAVLGVPENGENVPNSAENVPNSAENVSQLTDEQLQQYAHSAFNEATQSNGITIPQEQAEQLQQRNQQMLEQEQQRKEEEANRQPTALERVPINEETGEPMFEKADRETALDALNEITGGNDENTTAIVRAQVEQATKALEALKKKEPTKKAPSLKGSPMAMVKAQQEAEANYNTAMEEYNAQVAAAKENLNAWSRINSLMNDRKRAIREQQEAERKVREEKLHAEAVARLKEDKRIAAEKAAEQEAVGTHAVNPKIKAKWDGATKVEGNPNAITLADGSTIRGHYVLTEAGAATASHDVNNAYEPTEGFPVDENGESVNDRDYKRDKDAQRIVRDMADSYDSRALQTPVIVSKDGVVLSGNNRTMSGEIAAKNGTDKAYVDHLREFGAMFGFTPEQIDGMQHPRVVFVPDEELPYDASTFARFNAEQQKKQSKPEHAVKLGKIVPDNVFTSITNDISRFDRMSDYYADDKSVASAISQLLDAGVINEMQLPELRTGNALSAAGKELIENTLIGKVFQTSPDAVRQIISTPTLRQSVVMGLNEIANNRTLAKSGYDLSKELAAAVDLVSRAKSDSPEIYKEGMPVSPYGRQQGLFDDEYGDSRVTDGVTLHLADLLNSGKPSDLRKVLSTYNNEAASSAAGQIDMFSGDVTSKEEILKNVNEYFRNATPKEQQALIDAAVAERKRRAEAAEPAGGDEASEQATVVAGSDAEPQQPVVASEKPVKGNEPDADALAKEAEDKLSERITDTEDEWTEPSEYGEIYKHRMFVDGKEVIKVDAPDKSKNYPGTYYEIDGKQFGDLYEVANYIDGNEQPLSAKIEAASAEVNTDPTEAQKEAGNYKKGHVQVGTFDITIEQPQGSVRKGTDADGKQWESKMNNTYGYIRGAVGVDGDHIDVFLSNDIDGWNGRKVFVVDQYNPDGSFDEHKVMLGFNDMDEAKSDYLANYEKGWEDGRRIIVSATNLEDFEKWIDSSHRKTKPFAEYAGVKKETVASAPAKKETTAQGNGKSAYTITPSTYTNKKGKTSDVSLLTFNGELTADQERAVKEFAKERLGEGRFSPARGWKDRESGGWMFRSEEDARKAAEMVGNDEAVADNQPLTAQEMRDAVEPKKPVTRKKAATKKPANKVELADAKEQKPAEPTKVAEPAKEEKPQYEVSDEEMNGLMNDIRDILGIGADEGDTGLKFRDPDELTAEQRQKLMSVGQRLAMAMVERGNESFGDYASMMVKALGDKVRPWLKAFYGGLEYVPGYDKYALTPYDEVKAFDVENFDKPQHDALAQANMIVEESKAQVAANKANSELKEIRNEQRKEIDKQTEADTAALAKEAESVASEAEALAETSSDKQALNGAADRVDDALDKVNDQLALLGYYEADHVEKNFNEAYGYMRNAEKKAVKDAANLASQLIDDLGLDRYEATHSDKTDKKGNRKTKPLAVANIAPAGGDVTMHLPLAEGRELYVNVQLEPASAKGEADIIMGDNLEVTGIMCRLENPNAAGNARYGQDMWFAEDVTYDDLLKNVQRVAQNYLPKQKTDTDTALIDNPQSWVGRTFNYNGTQLVCKEVDGNYATFDNKATFMNVGFEVPTVQGYLKSGKFQVEGEKPTEPQNEDIFQKAERIAKEAKAEREKKAAEEADIMATDLPEPAKEKAVKALHGSASMTDNMALSEARHRVAKKKASKKKVKPEQQVGDLFAGLFDEPKEDNGLQRNDDAVRTEAVPTDHSGQQQGLRGGERATRKAAAQESGRPDGGRGGQSTGKDGAVSAGLHGLTEPKNTRNNHSERGADHAPTSVNGRIEANIKAIELAHELLESGETATPEQMSVLRQFSGWGGLGAAFSDGGYDWKQRERNKKIRELLGEEAYEQAVMSGNSAYYTPAYVVDTLWDIAGQLGFKGGNILEGSAGIGNILGQMPTTMSERSDIHAIEIDGTSGGILSLLYPDAKVDIQGFEQTRIPNGSVDLAITNVPFVTGLRVNDTTGDSDLSKKFHNIHDFCIAKNVRKLREGGLGIFISSNGTLDNSKALRDWVVNEGGSDFIGAFRMNNKTFGGTTVTSDIIVIRKRVNGQKSPQAIDVSTISGERTAEYQEPGARKAKQISMDYNKYFMEHPDHMAGEMRFAFEEGDTFRPTSKGLYPVSGKDQGKMLADFVKSFTEETGGSVATTESAKPSYVSDASADGKKLGEMYIKDGKLVTAGLGGYYPLEVNDKKIKGHTKQECFNAYAAIKTALADVMKYQTDNEDNAGLKPLIAKLNKAYDDFVNTYGHFNKNNQLAWLRNDVDYPNVFSLETYKELGDGKGGVVKTYGKADVMKDRVVEKESEPHPENVKDGVVVSMFKNGRIDVPYIAGQLGKSEAEVKREIIDSGLGFEDPATRQMEVSYQYLSGNVREKLKQAEANNENGEYNKNIKALQDVVPMNIPAHLIDFTLGSSWLDPKLYDEYVKDRTGIDVHFTAAGGTWFMKAPTYGLNEEKNRAMGVVSEMLKKTVMGHELIAAAIQNKSVVVSRTEKHYDGTTETITDREATAACAAKIDEIRQDFKDWARGKMQSDADLSARMETEYNDRFNNYVPMSIPDDFVPEYFGGAIHKLKMRPHQGKAIVRGTMQPLLLAHEVGTGKTFTLISTAMEMRRLGTARKPMIVVQNATVGQFAASAKELYPNAKVLVLDDNDRNADGRKNFYAKIKYNDWDIVIIPQSTLDKIPDSDERQMQFVQDKIDEKMLVLEQMRKADDSGRDPITRRAEKELADLQAEMAALTDGMTKKRTANNEKKKAVAKQNAAVKAQEMLDRTTDDVEDFDDMGIDALLIDEAHEYKHLGFATAMQRGVKGVDPTYSKKAQSVYLKTQAVLEKNNGRNVIFATGTPISNTAAEIWTFMRYLMPKDTMKEYGIYYFDDFVRNFGNIQQMPEFKTNGKYQEVNRFAGYVNLPELVRVWSSVSDTALTKDQTELVKKIPEMEGGKAQDIYLPQTRALRSVMKYVREELERFDKMSGKEKKANSSIPLTMYGIAQRAAVDARLVQVDAEDDPKSKTNEAVRQTLRSLKETDDYKGTVAIFADSYENKRSGFNLYEDIKKKLIAHGIPENEVVVMKPGMKIKQKLEIFDKVNRGEVRVVLGSTATLGTGVNIQERLHTLIHLDAPNRPMDYTQRNGRILRQGNLHKQWGKPVRVLRMGVEDSLDVTAYQRLKTKGAIADSVMEGDRLMQDSMNNRVLEEEEDVFGDTVAQLSGSEYALLKNNAEKNVRKYESRKKQWEADQTYIHNAKPKLEGQIKAAEQRAKEANAHMLAVQKAFPDGKFTEITVGKQKFHTVEDMADFIKEHNKKILDAVKAMKENPSNATQTNTLTLSLGGYDFVVKTEMSRETVNSGGSLFAEIHRRMSYSCPELGLTDIPVKQSLLRNAVEDITENVITGKDFAERFDVATRTVQHGKSELEQMKQREGKPFEYSKELEEAKRQFEEYSEAMKVEMAEKEKKYAEMDASVEAATDVVADDEDETPEDKTKFRLLEDDDPKAIELESLPYSELVPVYRNVQAFEDDALGSPMAFTDAETGERRTLEGRRWNYSAPPKVELTEEQQRKLDELNKIGYIMVDGKKSTELQINDGLKFVKPKTKEAQLQYFLKKNPEDKGLWAAYDPYDHAIETPLNTQFGEAYKRPNLVVVRSLIPKSEIDEPFHADYALLSTGAHQWNNGRTLYLSRWSKIDKVLTREEEAKLIDEYWKKHPGKREELKTHRDYNRFVPQVRRELEKMGYRFELDGKELTPEESLALDKQNWDNRDVIPGREGHAPFMTNEDIARINAKMSGKWVGEPKEAMENAMTVRVNELAERLHTPVRIIRTDEEVAALPSARQRRMKGSFNPITGEVTIVVPNNANMADVENTFIHEVVGHDGLRVLFPEEDKLNNALDELYRVSKDEIRNTIDRMAQKMYDAEVDRLREKKRKEHEVKGEDANASYYADMAEAHAEASKKREQFKRDATEEYGADLAGRIGEKGFEKMSAEELTFWGKLKSMLQKALQKLLEGLKIPGRKKWGDKEWAFVLHEAYKRKKNGGKPDVFDAADTEVMRRKTGFGETKFSDGHKKSAKHGEARLNAFQLPSDAGHNVQSSKAALKHLEPIETEHDAKVLQNREKAKEALANVAETYKKVTDTKGFLTALKEAMGLIGNGSSAYRAFELPNGDSFVVRVSNHNARAHNVKDGERVESIVIKRKHSPNRFEPANGKIVDEYVYFKEDIRKAPAGTLSSIAESISDLLDTGEYHDKTGLAKDNHSPETDPDGGIMFRDGDMGLDETITQMKIAASQANADNWQAKQEAMKAIGGNLNKLRQAMARQREYDLSTVKSITDLAKVLLDKGLLDDLSKYETKRILSAVNNANGKQDTSKYVEKLMDMMVSNQLRAGENRLGRLEKIRGSRVDARGIEVQGQLDADGQAVMKAFRSAKPLSVEELNRKILEATDRMSNSNEQIAANATIEYTGLQLAKQYVEGVSESKKAENQFKDEIKKAEEEMNAGQMTEEAFKQFKEAVDETIKQLKIDRIEAYNNLADSFGGVLGESAERAKQWKEAEKERVNKIHHLANSDMQGRELKGHRPDTKVQWLANSWVARFAFEPLSTFDQMLKMFGSKNPNGEGYMQDYFMRHWIDSTDNEQLLKERYQKQMDDKAAEIFGKKYKYLDLYGYAQAQKSANVKYYDGAEMREYEIPQDGLLYLYAVEKMPMGKATNRRMGITDEMMEQITEALDPKLKEFTDWVQEEFLPMVGMESDAVYTRMFGTHMDSIENYFPFVRDKDALKRDVENGQDNDDNDRISVQTGAIKKRVASVALWNMKDMSFLDVLAKHVSDMSHWQSFAELNRDIGTLISYNHFKQQVKNMSSVYGSGDRLWQHFEQCAAIATDCYKPKRAEFDRLMVQGAKGVTMGKIAFRPFTALKQTLSLPAFFGEVDAVDMAEALATGGIPALKWSWKNMPNFRKRILSRTTGDYRLRETEYDNKIMKAASYGMLPNIGVDAWTVAVGSHCVYKAKKRKYLRWGMSEEQVERRAVQDAEMCFNKSQQSSEGAYMAPVQIDHTFWATSAMLFRNSSTAYTRETHNSARNLKRIISGEVSEDYVAKQILRTVHPNADDYWSDAEWAQARTEAKREIRSAKVKNGVNLVMFGWILPWLWRIGGASVLLALSGDNEEKSKQLIDATRQSFLAPMEGLTYGDVFEGGINKMLGYAAQSWEQQGRENPMISDMKQMVKEFDYDWLQATNDVLNILGGMTTGVNPQTFTDWVVAIMDYCGDDAKSSHECALLAARLLNCPQSQLDKVYLEELDLTAKEASKMTPAEVAERYARYKMMREAPLTGWMRSSEQRDSISAKKQQKVFTIAKEKMSNRMETEATKKLLSTYDEVSKQQTELSKLKHTDRAAYREGMKQLRQSNDMRQHMRLKRYKHDMNELTSKYLRCKSAEERDSIVSTMFSTRAKMLEDIGRLKQQ